MEGIVFVIFREGGYLGVIEEIRCDINVNYEVLFIFDVFLNFNRYFYLIIRLF